MEIEIILLLKAFKIKEYGMFLLLLGTGQSSPTRYWLPTKSHTETIANKILANYLGKEYAVHIEIVGEPLYSMLVFRLKKEEQVLYQHPSYEKIEKLA